jgi:hypothetical protein
VSLRTLLLVIGLSVLPRFTDSDYPSGIFKLFLRKVVANPWIRRWPFKSVNRGRTDNPMTKRSVRRDTTLEISFENIKQNW